MQAADIVYANTFGANRYKMENTGYSVKGINYVLQLKMQRTAAKGTDTLVALDVRSYRSTS